MARCVEKNLHLFQYLISEENISEIKMFCPAKVLLCLVCSVNGLNTNAYTNERIKQITQEIMHPDSRYMSEISERTKEIMSPCSKYMTEIRRRLGLPPGSCTGEV